MSDIVTVALADVANWRPAFQGQRNQSAFALAQHLASLRQDGHRLSEVEIVELVAQWNQRNLNPLKKAEISQIVSCVVPRQKTINMKITTLRVVPLVSQVQLFDAIVSNLAEQGVEPMTLRQRQWNVIFEAAKLVVDAIEESPQESENTDK